MKGEETTPDEVRVYAVPTNSRGPDAIDATPDDTDPHHTSSGDAIWGDTSSGGTSPGDDSPFDARAVGSRGRWSPGGSPATLEVPDDRSDALVGAEPSEPPRRRWRTVVGIAAIIGLVGITVSMLGDSDAPIPWLDDAEGVEVPVEEMPGLSGAPNGEGPGNVTVGPRINTPLVSGGLTWRTPIGAREFEPYGWFHVVANETGFVVVGEPLDTDGDYPIPEPRWWFSPDGLAWEPIQPSAAYFGGYVMATDNSFFGIGNTRLIRSDNGTDWIDITPAEGETDGYSKYDYQALGGLLLRWESGSLADLVAPIDEGDGGETTGPPSDPATIGTVGEQDGTLVESSADGLTWSAWAMIPTPNPYWFHIAELGGHYVVWSYAPSVSYVVGSDPGGSEPSDTSGEISESSGPPDAELNYELDAEFPEPTRHVFVAPQPANGEVLAPTDWKPVSNPPPDTSFPMETSDGLVGFPSENAMECEIYDEADSPGTLERSIEAMSDCVSEVNRWVIRSVAATPETPTGSAPTDTAPTDSAPAGSTPAASAPSPSAPMDVDTSSNPGAPTPTNQPGTTPAAQFEIESGATDLPETPFPLHAVVVGDTMVAPVVEANFDISIWTSTDAVSWHEFTQGRLEMNEDAFTEPSSPAIASNGDEVVIFLDVRGGAPLVGTMAEP